MGPELLDLEVQSLRSRAARYRKIGGLLGDTEASTALNKLAHELDVAVEALVRANDLIGATVQNAHRLWLSFDVLIPKLQTHRHGAYVGSGGKGRAVAKAVEIVDGRSRKRQTPPRQRSSCRRAFEIAQLAEKLARDAESKFA